MQLKVITLGAGQDVGRSCVVVSLGGKTFMFDCGMHMGYRDQRRYPDFKLLSRTGNFTELIDAVVVTHFHLDHCGALPYFTEVLGYDGPIYMTSPTRALVPIMLEDYHRVLTERKGQSEVFSRQQIQDCMHKVTVINLHQTLQLDEECEVKAFYAGHVLGAAMFHVRVGMESVVYTGDYNMTPDRHIGNARMECLRPDLLITESTYATTLRESKRTQERDFLSAVHDTVARGGKVLIPVFAVGRAQELLLLLREHWERMGLQVPIYFSTGMAAKANLYYNLLVNWASQSVQHVALEGKDPFGFNYVKPWHRNLTHVEGPCVLFATPGMLHGGTSLEVFKVWATNPGNLVVLPGYCVSGTVGNKLMCGVTKGLKLGGEETMDVKCQVRYLSFSAHTDLKGILTLLHQSSPQHVMLVHGEKAKMEFLKDKIIRTFGVACYIPANNSILRLTTKSAIPVNISSQLLTTCLKQKAASTIGDDTLISGTGKRLNAPQAPNNIPLVSILLAQHRPDGAPPFLQLVAPAEAPAIIGSERHILSYSCDVPADLFPQRSGHWGATKGSNALHERTGNSDALEQRLEESGVVSKLGVVPDSGPVSQSEILQSEGEVVCTEPLEQEDMLAILNAAREAVQSVCPLERVEVGTHYMAVRSFHAKLSVSRTSLGAGSSLNVPGCLSFRCSWTHDDNVLGETCVFALKSLTDATG